MDGSDLFLVFHRHDHDLGQDFTEMLGRRGIGLGPPIEVFQRTRLLQRVDQGLHHSRFGLVILTQRFLSVPWPSTELDGIANRRRVISLLHDVTEEEIASRSLRLTDTAITAGMLEHLVELLRPHDSSDRTNGR